MRSTSSKPAMARTVPVGCAWMSGLTRTGLERMHERLAAFERGVVPGLLALVASGDDVNVEVLGHPSHDDLVPRRRDAIFRIASLSKPMGAAGAMALVDDGLLSRADPVEAHLPELADRRVLRCLGSPLDDTVPAAPSISAEDLLTFRLGFAAVMDPPRPYPVQAAEAELQLAALGPPWPPPPFGPGRMDPPFRHPPPHRPTGDHLALQRGAAGARRRDGARERPAWPREPLPHFVEFWDAAYDALVA
jgi:CubicO group peptidase (beta-lactamase class C family)